MYHNLWPELDFKNLQDTLTTVQLFTQIAGKIRLKKMPWLNHSWNVTLYVSSRGLTTSAMPYANGNFELEFDFIHHRLNITTSNGGEDFVALYPVSVADFYEELIHKLLSLGIEVNIYAKPNEVEPAIPFAQDKELRIYDREQMNIFFKALVNINTVFNEFRAGFTGKSSPVHFFWGGFDLAVTRFSGRPAPMHAGGMPNMPLDVMQEAYSHEVSSGGFWPGNKDFPYPVFYAYCYPVPATFKDEKISPASAFYSEEMGEFMLKYEDVMKSSDPEKLLLSFLESTYDAAAKTGNWQKEELEFHFNRIH